MAQKLTIEIIGEQVLEAQRKLMEAQGLGDPLLYQQCAIGLGRLVEFGLDAIIVLPIELAYHIIVMPKKN